MPNAALSLIILSALAVLTFDKKYFCWAVLLFSLETGIALFVHDNFIRPYFGDVLVVVLIYCFVKSFVKIEVIPAAVCVLLFAFFIEGLQYLNLVEKLGLQHNKIARTVIGTSFSWEDLLCYLAGFVIVLLSEKTNTKFTDSRE